MLKFVVLLVTADVVDGELDDDVTSMVPPLTTLEDDAVRAAAENSQQRLVADATTQLVAALRARL